MNITKIVPSFSDNRGEITDIVSNEKIEHVTVIHSKKGSVRGNHYHKETEQLLYVMSGSVKVVSQIPGGERVETTLYTGDLVRHEHEERHAFLALEDTTWLVLTRGLRGGADYEKDTFRLDTPLIKG